MIFHQVCLLLDRKRSNVFLCFPFLVQYLFLGLHWDTVFIKFVGYFNWKNRMKWWGKSNLCLWYLVSSLLSCIYRTRFDIKIRGKSRQSELMPYWQNNRCSCTVKNVRWFNTVGRHRIVEPFWASKFVMMNDASYRRRSSSTRKVTRRLFVNHEHCSVEISSKILSNQLSLIWSSLPFACVLNWQRWSMAHNCNPLSTWNRARWTLHLSILPRLCMTHALFTKLEAVKNTAKLMYYSRFERFHVCCRSDRSEVFTLLQQCYNSFYDFLSEQLALIFRRFQEFPTIVYSNRMVMPQRRWSN